MRKDALQMLISGALSGEHLTERSMNFYLDRISATDTAKLWEHLRASAKAALPRTTWVQWVNGTIERVGLRLDVTACTTHDGFVLHFTVRDTSTLNGGANAAK